MRVWATAVAAVAEEAAAWEATAAAKASSEATALTAVAVAQARGEVAGRVAWAQAEVAGTCRIRCNDSHACTRPPPSRTMPRTGRRTRQASSASWLTATKVGGAFRRAATLDVH